MCDMKQELGDLKVNRGMGTSYIKIINFKSYEYVEREDQNQDFDHVKGSDKLGMVGVHVLYIITTCTVKRENEGKSKDRFHRQLLPIVYH